MAKINKGKKIHEAMAEVITTHAPSFEYGGKPGSSLFDHIIAAGATVAEHDELFKHRLCPTCGMEAADLTLKNDFVEFQSIVAGTMHVEPTGKRLITMRCPSAHSWTFAMFVDPPSKPPPPPWTGSNKLFLEGQVDAWGTTHNLYGPTIGNLSVIDELSKAFDLRYATPEPKVRVMLGILPQASITELGEVEGELSTYAGAPGSEVTPAELPEIKIGKWNLLSQLYDYDGHTVALDVRLAEDSP